MRPGERIFEGRCEEKDRVSSIEAQRLLARSRKLPWVNAYLLNILIDEEERWRWGVEIDELIGGENLWKTRSFG